MNNIRVNIDAVKKNIEQAACRADRNPEDIILVCVTKSEPVEIIAEAVNCGINTIGENRVEEALDKFIKLPKGLNWHMIGHLQTRKVKEAVKIFNLIHSVDSLNLAYEIDKRAKAIGKVQDILIEVNISGEEAKYGLFPQGLKAFIQNISNLSNVNTMGLMTMAPLSEDAELTRPVFKRLRELSEEIKALNIKNVKMQYLSMGMTQDYRVAVEEGANMVRIGTAIFR